MITLWLDYCVRQDRQYPEGEVAQRPGELHTQSAARNAAWEVGEGGGECGNTSPVKLQLSCFARDGAPAIALGETIPLEWLEPQSRRWLRSTSTATTITAYLRY